MPAFGPAMRRAASWSGFAAIGAKIDIERMWKTVVRNAPAYGRSQLFKALEIELGVVLVMPRDHLIWRGPIVAVYPFSSIGETHP